jgi:hypothetical protein
MADESNQEIIEIKYIARVDEALANAEKMRSFINAIKVDIQNLAAQSGQSFDIVAASMKKAFSSDISANIKNIKAQLAEALKQETVPEVIASKKNVAREQIKEQLAARREFNEYTMKALAQLNAAESKFAKESVAREKDKAAQKKAIMQQEKAALLEYQAAWKASQKTGEMGVMTKQAQEMGAKIQELKQRIIEYSKEHSVSFNRAAQDIYNKGTIPIKQMQQAVRELNSEMRNTSTGSTGFLGFLQSLGTVGQAVFGFTLGTLAVQALRSITNWFKEAAKAGFEYAQALKRLEISTQILQERGMNITMKETLDLVTELNRQFPIFTRKQIVEGVGYIQLLSQNLGLSTEQMKEMNKVAGALAVVLGKDVNEAAKELALFLTSGYGEALQRAGILASKQAVTDELRRMGIQKDITMLTKLLERKQGITSL